MATAIQNLAEFPSAGFNRGYGFIYFVLKECWPDCSSLGAKQPAIEAMGKIGGRGIGEGKGRDVGVKADPAGEVG